MTNPYVKARDMKIESAKLLIKYLVLIVAGLVMVYPMFWVFLNSFKDNNDIYAHPFSLPTVWRVDNYINTLSTSHLNVSFLNSTIVTISTILLTILVCSMASFVIARVEFKLNFAVLTFFLLGLMVPEVSCLLPLFILYQKVKMINSLVTLILIYSTMGMSVNILMMTGFMKSIPKEIEESAIIDGSSMPRVFWSFIIPLSRVVIVTVAILTFLWTWNEYLFGLVFISKPLLKTLPVALAGFKTAHQVFYGPMSAGIIITVIPVILVYTVLQEQVIRGMTMGAVKG